MTEIPFRSGKHFERRHLIKSAMPGLAAAAVVTLYLTAILQLGSEAWWAYGCAIAFASILLVPAGWFSSRRMDRAISHAIDREHAGNASHEDVIAGYAAASKLPAHGVGWYFMNWVVAALVVPIFMALWLGSLSVFTAVCIALASLTGGLAVAPFVYYALRSLVAPVVDHWGSQLDAEERAANTLAVPLRHKLRFPVAAVSASTVVFLCLLAYSLASRPVELQDLRVKKAFLNFAAQQIVDREAASKAAAEAAAQAAAEAAELEEGRDGELESSPAEAVELAAAPAGPKGQGFGELARTAREFEAAHQFLLVEGSSGDVLAGTSTLQAHEIAWLMESPTGGDSGGYDSDHSFAWLALPDGSGRVLVAVTPGSVFSGSLQGALIIFVLVFFGALGFGVGTAYLLVGDITDTAARIQEQAEEIASGNLMIGEIIESEDELGELARTFANMKSALRDTISSVSAASSRVDEAAGGLAEIGGGVAQTSQEQVAGIEQATTHVAGINRNVAQITEASHALSSNVEEASSSVLELGAAGEQLNSTAQALNQQVGEVTSSIEQMVRSVNAVSEHTGGLTDAVSDTSSSMSEMTRSMREVENHAIETAKLSSQVIELADSGREQVQQTIKGMDEIRDATESADQVIKGLASRMSEIGAIVDVIDDVADETNLLALNAAIIAAQSGEQGRAFSVVADEIKDLADRVLASTKEIGSLISSVQNESSAAARAIERGTERVQGGVDLSAQAGVALEEITVAARDSGGRIEEIVAAVREQARAAGHVEQLMERVSMRVDEIRQAGLEQQRGNEVVMRGAVVMRDVAQQTQRTTEEQSSGAGRIRDSMESVRDAVEHIHQALQEQGEACKSAVSFLEEVFHRTRSNDESAEKLREGALSMQRQAEALREDVRNFRIE